MRFEYLACLLIAVAPGCRKGASASTSGDVSESGEGIPTSVFGGGQPVQVVAEGTGPLRLHFGFERGPIDDPDHKYVERWKLVPAGKHTFTISIPAGVSGGVDVTLTEAKDGDRATCVLSSAGKELRDEHLQKGAVEPGYAAFAQVNVDDWTTLEPESD